MTWAGFMAMTGPYGFFAVAPQLVHVGTGGRSPLQSSGVCTGPWQFEQVPMVGMVSPLSLLSPGARPGWWCWLECVDAFFENG